jgi:hypothetical protein
MTPERWAALPSAHEDLETPPIRTTQPTLARARSTVSNLDRCSACSAEFSSPTLIRSCSRCKCIWHPACTASSTTAAPLWNVIWLCPNCAGQSPEEAALFPNGTLLKTGLEMLPPPPPTAERFPSSLRPAARRPTIARPQTETSEKIQSNIEPTPVFEQHKLLMHSRARLSKIRADSAILATDLRREFEDTNGTIFNVDDAFDSFYLGLRKILSDTAPENSKRNPSAEPIRPTSIEDLSTSPAPRKGHRPENREVGAVGAMRLAIKRLRTLLSLCSQARLNRPVLLFGRRAETAARCLDLDARRRRSRRRRHRQKGSPGTSKTWMASLS